MSATLLSKNDIDRLLADRSIRAQLDMVEKLTEQYAARGVNALNEQQTAIANDIFKTLLTRADQMVRAMLAMTLSQMDNLPSALARQMALDVSSEVAMPVLQYSKSLSDDDLVDIIRTMADDERLIAIARRESVSEQVSDLLTDTRIKPVINALVRNESANITRKTFHKIIEQHSNDSEIIDSLFQRNSVPVEVVEKVISYLSDTMRRHFEQKYGDLYEMKEVKKALAQSLELTRIKMMGFHSTDRELMQLVHHLDEQDRLTPFSALSTGNMQLFEVSLSRLLRIPLANVHLLLEDKEGFKVVYDRAQLPPHLYAATTLALEAIRLLEQESLKKIGRKEIYHAGDVLSRMQKLSTGQTIEGLDALTAIIRHCGR